MNLDVDFLIDFFNKHSGGGFKDEIDEQDAGATTTAPSGGGGGGASSAGRPARKAKRGDVCVCVRVCVCAEK